MDLEENKISLTAVRQYLKLLISNVDVFTRLEFKTLRGWMLYSLSLVFALCFPCVIILFITGLLSGNIELELLVAVSLIPFMFILPLTLLLTFIHNYR